MKKLVLLGAFVTLFSSCSSDDNINVTITEPKKEAHMEIRILNTGNLENFIEHDLLTVMGKNSLELHSNGKPLKALLLNQGVTSMYEGKGSATEKAHFFTAGKVDNLLLLKNITPIQKNIGTELKTNIKIYANGQLKKEYNHTFKDDAPEQLTPNM